jgi:hypothetical protein
MQEPKRALRGSKELKPRARLPIDDDRFEKHGCRSDPQSEVAIECAIDDELLFGLRMPRGPEHLIFLALIVPIATRLYHRVFFPPELLSIEGANDEITESGFGAEGT